MPCYSPWDLGLQPGTEKYTTARARVEALAESTRHTIDAYLEMYGIEPLGQRREFPGAPELRGGRTFELEKLSFGMIHRLAQHCMCDGISASDLRDAASILDDESWPDRIFRLIVLDIHLAIRSQLSVGRYDRARYHAQDFWHIRKPIFRGTSEPFNSQPWKPRESEIATSNLRLEHLPGPEADEEELERFALTFHGYAAFPDELCGTIANARLHRSIDEIRACLFFEFRRYRHGGWGPSEEDARYLRVLVEKLRKRLSELS